MATLQDFDVIPGRGHRSNHHPGNRYYLSLARNRAERYNSAPNRRAKRAIAGEVIAGVRAVGGRFLKFTERRWYVVPDPDAFTKVMQCLRDRAIEYRRDLVARPENLAHGNDDPPDPVAMVDVEALLRAPLALDDTFFEHGNDDPSNPVLVLDEEAPMDDFAMNRPPSPRSVYGGMVDLAGVENVDVSFLLDLGASEEDIRVFEQATAYMETRRRRQPPAP